MTKNGYSNFLNAIFKINKGVSIIFEKQSNGCEKVQLYFSIVFLTISAVSSGKLTSIS